MKANLGEWQTMTFCKKCHKRIVKKFNGPHHAVWEGDRVCRCDIIVAGNEDGPKVLVQPRRGSRKVTLKPVRD